eukprot:GHVL01034302.1.p1 GENE.GHVL01034302.1~~GHVL01034302.1.p1  ORF type:complete len:206 (+),score=51.87 GHVL01034302.1:42-620(+)
MKQKSYFLQNCIFSCILICICIIFIRIYLFHNIVEESSISRINSSESEEKIKFEIFAHSEIKSKIEKVMDAYHANENDVESMIDMLHIVSNPDNFYYQYKYDLTHDALIVMEHLLQHEEVDIILIIKAFSALLYQSPHKIIFLISIYINIIQHNKCMNKCTNELYPQHWIDVIIENHILLESIKKNEKNNNF